MDTEVMKPKKERLDRLVVEQGLVVSRERAKAMIMAGQVVVDDHTVDKPGAMVARTSKIRIKGEDIPYVSRGGLKLAAALKTFDVDVTGLVVLDVGASTGGFTDCVLQHGARQVLAVDVGYGQLAWKLRTDNRVVNLEKTNIRYLERKQLPVVPDLAVIDASFISLEKVLPNTLRLLRECGQVIALVKPQFEVGKGEVGKGGIVRDAGKHVAVLESVCATAKDLGLEVRGSMESPISGAKGNKEFLIHLVKTPPNQPCCQPGAGQH